MVHCCPFAWKVERLCMARETAMSVGSKDFYEHHRIGKEGIWKVASLCRWDVVGVESHRLLAKAAQRAKEGALLSSSLRWSLLCLLLILREMKTRLVQQQARIQASYSFVLFMSCALVALSLASQTFPLTAQAGVPCPVDCECERCPVFIC